MTYCKYMVLRLKISYQGPNLEVSCKKYWCIKMPNFALSDMVSQIQRQQKLRNILVTD